MCREIGTFFFLFGGLKMHTKNFCEYDFICRCGKCSHSVPYPSIVSEKLMIALQQARNKLNAPIFITSGRRCKKHNKEVGGNENSYHLTGLAADVRADDMIKLFKALKSVPAFSYIEPHDSYIHVDIGRKRENRINDKRTVCNDAA